MSNPFLAHSEISNEIYIICGKNKYPVTEQVVSAMKATGRLNNRPQGEWRHNSDHPDNLICSVCNCEWDMWRYESKELKFCPNCGAKMTKEAENEQTTN